MQASLHRRKNAMLQASRLRSASSIDNFKTMSNAAAAELYFIGAMMILILIVASVATYLFFRQYKIEKRDRDKINERARAEAERE